MTIASALACSAIQSLVASNPSAISWKAISTSLGVRIAVGDDPQGHSVPTSDLIGLLAHRAGLGVDIDV